MNAPTEALFSELLSHSTTAVIEELVSRAKSLYTLPAVAAEVLELTGNPKADVRALKACIERDPALTVRILRVVNSSLFGLSREVSDLNQALALLGIKPLKLLVLGFSLPDSLFADVAHEQLIWYWRGTLARAVAARELSEVLFGRPGDEAFLAGLLQDLGILVLLGQLKESYANFLDRAIEDGADLNLREMEVLGFDHTTLTSTLLDSWNMPTALVQAVGAVRAQQVPMHDQSSQAHLTRVLQLAHLLTDLVSNNRLSVLPRLLELGTCYCELDKGRLKEMVRNFQPKVQQLAEVLSIELPVGRDYSEILIEAHAEMSQIVETVAEPLSRTALSSDVSSDHLLWEESLQIKTALNELLQCAARGPEVVQDGQLGVLGTRTELPRSEEEAGSISFAAEFSQRLTLAVGHARSQRQPLSLIIFQIFEDADVAEKHSQMLDRLIWACCEAENWPEKQLESETSGQVTVILPGCDRQEAVQFGQQVIRGVERSLTDLNGRGNSVAAHVSAGIASVSLPPKNFRPQNLLQTAQRCLTAAVACESSLIKSLEIY